MRTIERINDELEDVGVELRRTTHGLAGLDFWTQRKVREACEKMEAQIRYLQAERKAVLEGREMPINPGHILCERECEGCGAPLGRGPWVETVEPGTTPRLSGRNLTDEEIGAAFWEKYPYLIGVTVSKKVSGRCMDCRES